MAQLSLTETETASLVVRAQRVDVWAALLAIIRLIKDPQDTRQVALMEMALAGNSQAKVFGRFASMAAGSAVLREKRSLAVTLDAHEQLRALPENAFGRHYLAFVEREGLTAQGLRDATPATTEALAKRPEAVRLFYDYTTRDMHDLYHVLCGYGRDELGEICVLAMSYQQVRIRAYRVIYTLGPFVVCSKYLCRAGLSTQGVGAAVREAKRIGRAAAWVPGIEIEAALAEDIDELRARLNILRPAAYNAVTARLKAQSRWVNGPFWPDVARPPGHEPAPGRFKLIHKWFGLQRSGAHSRRRDE